MYLRVLHDDEALMPKKAWVAEPVLPRAGIQLTDRRKRSVIPEEKMRADCKAASQSEMGRARKRGFCMVRESSRVAARQISFGLGFVWVRTGSLCAGARVYVLVTSAYWQPTGWDRLGTKRVATNIPQESAWKRTQIRCNRAPGPPDQERDLL